MKRKEQQSPHLPSLVGRAASLVNVGRLIEALDEMRAALKLAPREEAVQKGMADILIRLRRPQEALPHLDAVARMRGGIVERIDLAKALDTAGHHREALLAYQRAVPLSPVKAPIFVLMSTSELARGRREQSRALLDSALAADPHDGYAHLSLATHFPDPGRIVEIDRAIVATGGRPKQLYEAPLRFALGRLKDRAGDVEGAFAAFHQANQLMAQLTAAKNGTVASAPFDQGGSQAEAARPGGAQASEQPVFVFGMPRSGTTLVEQIIASHPQAAAVGELELVSGLVGSLAEAGAGRCSEAYLAAYPDSVRSAVRVVDKSLSSWLHLGPILRMFPQARFIHCRRHPMDICWSAYTELFSDNATIYSYSFERLAERYRLYDATLRRARDQFKGRMIDISYEQLVADPEAETRRLIAFCELPFDPACLSPERTARTVRTASMGQVRQPIYSSSAGKWRRYSGHLQALQQSLVAEIAHYETG